MSKKLNFGPMDEKCFISRSELLQWVNNLLLVSVTRVEQLGCGSIYCQIFDVIYPGKIPLNKLKWKARHEYEFSHNFKLLQKGFDSVSVAKAIPIEKLVKAKYQDNLEFAQWMKRFFEINCKDKGRGYDPKKRRGMAEPDLSFCVGGVLPQYTMIYGNFKDMDREISSSDNEAEIENSKGSSTPSTSLNNSSSSSSAVDKENNHTQNQLQHKPQISEFEPTLSKKINSSESNAGSKGDFLIKIGDQSLENCPFFLNNNKINKTTHKQFSANLGNIKLIKALESREDASGTHSPSHSDSGLNDSILKSVRRTQSLDSSDSKNSGEENILKLNQIKQLLSLTNLEDQQNAPHLFSLLASIKSIVQ